MDCFMIVVNQSKETNTNSAMLLSDVRPGLQSRALHGDSQEGQAPIGDDGLAHFRPSELDESY